MKNLQTHLIGLTKKQLAKVGVGIYRYKNRTIKFYEHHPDEPPIWFNYIPPSEGGWANFPSSLGRGRPFFRYGAESNHPFALAIAYARDRPESSQFTAIRDVLAEFYQSLTPNSPADYFPLSPDSQLRGHPAWVDLMPWDPRTPAQYEQGIKEYALAENAAFSDVPGVGIEKGWKFLGPVHPDKLDIEARRLFYLLRSIQSKGYRRNNSPDGDISAHILVDGDQWAWRAWGGFHRAAVLTGLGWTSIPIRPTQVIRRGDVSFWPAVRSGIFTQKEALEIFDLVLAGTHTGEFAAFDRFLEKYKPLLN